MHDSADGTSDIILGVYLLEVLERDLKISYVVITESDKTFEGCTSPMFDLDMYEFNPLDDGVHPMMSTSLPFSGMSQK